MEFRIGNKNDLTGILELLKQLVKNAGFSGNIDLKYANNLIENNMIKHFLAEDDGKKAYELRFI